jgi:hypothetical protein
MVSVQQAKQRLTAHSRPTKEQARFAELIATGLNSASDAYRQAYKKKPTGDWWCRINAYRLLQKPHVQALVTKLKAQYESVRPSLTRVSKREILHGMATDEELDAMDRQRAIDIDNKMQGEYQERMHLTADVSVSMFRANGAIPWQLAETLPDVKLSPTGDSKTIDGCITNVVHTAPDGGTGTLAILDTPAAPQSHDKALPSSPDSESSPTPSPPAKRSTNRKGSSKLTPLQQRALRGPRAKL